MSRFVIVSFFPFVYVEKFSLGNFYNKGKDILNINSLYSFILSQNQKNITEKESFCWFFHLIFHLIPRKIILFYQKTANHYNSLPFLLLDVNLCFSSK